MLPLIWRHFRGTFLFSTILDQTHCIQQNGSRSASEWGPSHCAVPRCSSSYHVSLLSLIFRTNIVQKSPLSIHMYNFWCAPMYKKMSWCWRTGICKYLSACAKWEVWNFLHRSANKPRKLQARWAFTLFSMCCIIHAVMWNPFTSQRTAHFSPC